MSRRLGAFAEVVQGLAALVTILFVSGAMLYFVVRGPLTSLGQIMFEVGLYGLVALIVVIGLLIVLGILATPLLAVRAAHLRRGNRRV